MIRTNTIICCLHTAVMTLCSLLVLSACSDDSADDSAQREQERKTQEVKAQLAGSWNLDADGLPDFNLALTEYYFDDRQVAMTYYAYDYSTDGYALEVLTYDYTVLNSSENKGREVLRLRITPTQQTIDWVNRKNEEMIAAAEETGDKDYALYDIEEFTDTLQLFVKDNNSIGHLIPEEDIAYYESQGLKLEDDALYFQRGAVDVSSLDTKSVRESIALMISELEEYQALHDGDPSTLNMPKFMAKVKRASQTQHIYDGKGHELRQWMKSVPDDRMLCKMMIPGAHDSGTYGMYWDWLRTLAKTQDQDIKGQWDHGIRCFDLRVRKWNDENRLYHDLISCEVTLKEVFKQIQDKLRENPQDGAIIMVKVEGNNAAEWNWALRNISNYIPLGITRGEADNVATTKETVKLVEEYFLNQTVDGHPMLAKFHPDMTMKDLRGRVIVLLQNAPSESQVDYGKLKEYLAVDYGDKYGNMLGDTRPLKEQNDWEQRGGGDESTYGYLQRKTLKFRNLLFETVTNTDDSYWVYNAANGYYRDLTSISDAIPDYATYAQEAYPIFTRDIIRYGNPRGIVLMDYVGWDHFKRVRLATLAAWGTYSLIIGVTTAVMFTALTGFTGGVGLGILATTLGLAFSSGVLQSLFGTHWTTPAFYLFWLVYQALKADADYKDPKAHDLVKAIVEVNFPEQHETGVSNDPIDIGR